MSTAEPRVSYESPPIHEVALAVQFDALTALTAAHYGLYWDMIRERYPVPVEQGPIEQQLEEFGRVRLARPPELRLLNQPETPRMWFMTADRNELVQVQRDRFIRNWRRQGDEDKYPRYRVLRDRWAEEFRLFQQFVEAADLGPIRPNQVEVTYINQVRSHEGEAHTNPFRHFRVGALPDVWPQDALEDTRIMASWLMQKERRPFGRLRLDIRPAYVGDEKIPVWNMNLVARGAPTGEGVAGVWAFANAGHDRIVEAFDRLTSDEMHEAWGRR